ncbi:hypothetical protein [Streptomyces sp. NPDC002078]
MRVLYFPFTRCLESITLKRALLSFEGITLLDSLNPTLRAGVATEHIGASVELLADYETLMREGFIGVVDAKRYSEDWDIALTLAVAEDMEDDEFLDIARQSPNHQVTVLKERLPESFARRFYPGSGTFLEAVSLDALIAAQGVLDLIPDRETRAFARMRWRGAQLPELAAMFDRYRHVYGGNPHVDLPAYQLTFAQFSSLRINEALAVSDTMGITPYTDSETHARLVMHKMRSAAGNGGVTAPLMRLATLGELVNDRVLAETPVRDLVKFRDRNADKFRRFNRLMIEASHELASSDTAAMIAVRDKLLNRLQESRDRLAASYEDFFSGVALRSLKVVGSALVAAILISRPIGDVVAGAAAAQAAALGLSGDDLRQVLKVRSSEKKRSGLAYLIKVADEFGG